VRGTLQGIHGGVDMAGPGGIQDEVRSSKRTRVEGNKDGENGKSNIRDAPGVDRCANLHICPLICKHKKAVTGMQQQFGTIATAALCITF
jgi:hypothetical protein